MSGRFGESSNNNVSLSLEETPNKVDLSNEFAMLVDNPACHAHVGTVKNIKSVGANLSAPAPNGGGRFGESSGSNSFSIESGKDTEDLSTDFKLLADNQECYKHLDLSDKDSKKVVEVDLEKKPQTLLVPPVKKLDTKVALVPVKKPRHKSCRSYHCRSY